MLKKVMSLMLAIIMMFSMATISSFASVQEELTEEVILSLTGDEVQNCYNLLLDTKEKNPNITYDELNNMAKQFYLDCYNNRTRGQYDQLLINATGMNAQEVALAQQYPTDLAAVYTSSGIANTKANSRYYSGKFLGNADAFRHTSWNALLVQRFYRLGIGSPSVCMSKTKMWTDAHEYGTGNVYGLSSSQFEQDRSMDLLNNAAGRCIGETYYDSYEYSILEKVQDYTDKGYCQRIKKDHQMGYSFEEMKAIPTWSLRSTNTVGKN